MSFSVVIYYCSLITSGIIITSQSWVVIVMGSEESEGNTRAPDPNSTDRLSPSFNKDTESENILHNGARQSEFADEENDESHEERYTYYISLLENEDPGRRWKAAESLARLGDPRAVDPLIATLNDEDWRVRQKAAWALGYLGEPRAIPALKRAYRDDLEGVQEMIREAIDMITRRMTS
jgi:hypothetical protein